MAPKGSKKFRHFLDQASDALVGLVHNNKGDNKRRNTTESSFVWVPRPRPSKAENRAHQKLQRAIMKVGQWLDSMPDNQIDPDIEERHAFYKNAKPNFNDKKRWIVFVEL